MQDALFLAGFVYGLAIVIALSGAALIRLIVLALSWERPAKAPARPKAASATGTAPPSVGGIPEAHLVAITAAAYATIGAHRIVHIGTDMGDTGWSYGGRQTHHGSHRPSAAH